MSNDDKDRHYLKLELDELVGGDRTVFDFLRQGSLDGVWYWDLENPEHEWMSPEFWRLFGIDPATKEHLAAEWQDMIFEDDLALALDNFHKHCDDPDHPYDQIVRYRHARGHTVHVRCRGIAVRDDSGKPMRLLGAHNDYTALISAQAKLDSTVKRLKTVLDTATQGIVGLDRHKQVLDINPEARRILGSLTAETPFAWPSDVQFLERENMAPLDASSDPVEQTLAGRNIRKEIHLLTNGGARNGVYVELSSNTIGDDTASIKSVLVLEDVTEGEYSRQQIERASRLDALGQLTGGIAHDFNNLLATVQYAVQLSLNGQLDESKRRYLQAAETSIQRGSSLTNRLLTFAKRQPGLAESHLDHRLREPRQAHHRRSRFT